MDLEKLIRSVPDFPKPGIDYKDITPVLKNPAAFKSLVRQMIESSEAVHADKIVGIESRGFIMGAAMAFELGIGFCPARKKGKLPWKTNSAAYALEYGEDELEIHQDAVEAGESVLLVDDLVATGGTAAAAIKLVESLGAKVMGVSAFIELDFLKGRDKFGDVPLFSLVHY